MTVCLCVSGCCVDTKRAIEEDDAWTCVWPADTAVDESGYVVTCEKVEATGLGHGWL